MTQQEQSLNDLYNCLYIIEADINVCNNFSPTEKGLILKSFSDLAQAIKSHAEEFSCQTDADFIELTKRFLLVRLFFSSLFNYTHVSLDQDKIRKHNLKADEILLDKKRLDLYVINLVPEIAINHYQEILLRLDDNLPQHIEYRSHIHHTIALLYKKQNKWHEAIPHFETVLDVYKNARYYPECPYEICIQHALCYRELGAEEKVESTIKKFFTVKFQATFANNLTRLQQLLAESLFLQGKYFDAEDKFSKSFGIGISRCQAYAGEISKAIISCTTSLTDPTFYLGICEELEIYLLRATMYSLCGDKNQALLDLQKVQLEYSKAHNFISASDECNYNYNMFRVFLYAPTLFTETPSLLPLNNLTNSEIKILFTKKCQFLIDAFSHPIASKHSLALHLLQDSLNADIKTYSQKLDHDELTLSILQKLKNKIDLPSVVHQQQLLKKFSTFASKPSPINHPTATVAIKCVL